MNILIAARLAFSRILATKTRSGLTMLGIIIGVMSLIALVSVAQGATSGIQDQFKGLGARNLNITGTTSTSLTIDDVREIEKEPGIEIVSETVSGRATLSSNQASTRAQIVGVDSDYKTVVDPDIFVGSFLPDVETASDARLIVLSTTLATDLELDAFSIGSTIAVGSTEFTIVGILDDADGFGTRGTAYIPLETAFKYVAVPPYLSSITVQTINEDIVPEVTANLTALLKARHNITGEREADFVITDASQLLDAIGSSAIFISIVRWNCFHKFGSWWNWHHEHHVGVCKRENQRNWN